MKEVVRGCKLKYTPSGMLDEPSVTEWWEMCARLYAKATYVNDVAIAVNPGTDREVVVEVKFKDGDKWFATPQFRTYISDPPQE